MSTLEAYVGRVEGLLISLMDKLSPAERKEVDHLIQHGEPAEAILALAWIIVDENKLVPADTVQAIYDLSKGLVDREDLPPDLESHIEPDT